MKNVVIYSTPSCTYCHMAKEFFTEKNIPYTEYNVGTDAARRKEMIDISGQMGVPVIQIDDEVMVGFDKSELEAKLGISA